MNAYEFAARRKRLNVHQRTIEKHFGLPAGSMGGIEDGRLRVVEAQIAELNNFLDTIERARATDAREEVMAA